MPLRSRSGTAHSSLGLLPPCSSLARKGCRRPGVRQRTGKAVGAVGVEPCAAFERAPISHKARPRLLLALDARCAVSRRCEAPPDNQVVRCEDDLEDGCRKGEGRSGRVRPGQCSPKPWHQTLQALALKERHQVEPELCVQLHDLELHAARAFGSNDPLARAVPDVSQRPRAVRHIAFPPAEHPAFAPQPHTPQPLLVVEHGAAVLRRGASAARPRPQRALLARARAHRVLKLPLPTLCTRRRALLVLKRPCKHTSVTLSPAPIPRMHTHTHTPNQSHSAHTQSGASHAHCSRRQPTRAAGAWHTSRTRFALAASEQRLVCPHRTPLAPPPS
eukprot:521517-Rhodomonas_salina.2